jgi:protein tyrosine phosphatase (PTP) superfamily phosphohydrolase (DUF442 family)
MGLDGSFNFHRVNANITTSGVVGDELLRQLGSEGYDAVINLLPDSSEHAVSDEADIVVGQGLTYVHIPVDFEAPEHSDLEAFSTAMDELEGKTVHIHCAANYRVTAFYGLHAVAKGDQSATDADELAGHFWSPADYPAWATFIAEERARIDRGSPSP